MANAAGPSGGCGLGENAELIIRNDLSDLNQVADWLDRFSEEHGLPSPCTCALQVALDEVVTNIMRHSGPDPKPLVIRMAVEKEARELAVEVIDDGPPFDPRQAPEPDLTSSLEERKIGGLGCMLVRKLMDRIDYFRNGGLNHLVLHKRFPPAA